MRILLLCHSFNSLAQRFFVELAERGHDVTVEFDVNDAVTIEAVALARPDLVVAPFLKRAIPREVFESTVCLVVHPGPPGDRGPAALDHAILDSRREWGITLLQADATMDGGPVWESEAFALRDDHGATKSSLYRNEVTDAAVRALARAIERFPDPAGAAPAPGTFRPAPKQAARAIDWARHTTEDVLRRIRSGDGTPGVLDAIDGRQVYLYDAHPLPRRPAAAAAATAAPGALVGRTAEGAVCRATVDGAIAIGHLRARTGAGTPSLKLPAVTVLGEAALRLAEIDDAVPEIVVTRPADGVAVIDFAFYNGAMSTAQCARLRAVYDDVARGDDRVVVLRGGHDNWSNGIHLGVIEHAPSAPDESMRNIEAIDDLALSILSTTDKLTISALSGNAGAGGVFLALAADEVWARRGIVLNPHYKSMGNLFGSEYWTYTLPRRAGDDAARIVTQARLPMGTAEARRLGLVDDAFGDDVPSFRAEVLRRARTLAAAPDFAERLAAKRARREADEAARPLAAYRADELAKMRMNFYGFDPSYHVARYNFIFKVPKSRTPSFLARHRVVR